MKGGKQKDNKSHAFRAHESYDYYVDEEANGEMYCSFETSEAEYTVYFNPNEYRNKVAEYPFLLNSAYGFGFFQFPKQGVVVPQNDSKIKRTIEKIICDFYSDNPNAVLLYHCYYADGKQSKRSMKFERWYCGSSSKDMIKKYEIDLEILTNGEYIKHYIGYLGSAENKNINLVQQEFESFALSLPDDKEMV